MMSLHRGQTLAQTLSKSMRGTDEKICSTISLGKTSKCEMFEAIFGNKFSVNYNCSYLNKFDFIVASIHSVLKMTIEKATSRLITAIENPYTTILGHPTGRLLLSREGYPIDCKKIIDACSANHVVLELNANPMRLDIDWRWIYYAMEKNVKISINPDAHNRQGYHHMQFGVNSARKGGLTKKMTFNVLPRNEIMDYFCKRKVDGFIS